MPALADGGNGGASILHPGGTGGAGFEGTSGGAGALISAGGGGAAGGGRGGDGSGLTPGEGGAGGTAVSPNGQNGGDGFLPVSSGGGGGGGYNGNGAGAATINNSGTLTGGNGGRGGDGGFLDGSGGGGGAGGYGAIVTGSGVSNNLAGGTITGGNGGRGGVGKDLIFAAGNGGDGGVGLQFTSPGAIFLNAGTITGGNGAAAGGTRLGAASGDAGRGGIGVVGAGVTLINSGTISAGVHGPGSPAPQQNAITFTGGTNVLELRAGSTINGNVSAFSAADTLRLGGSTNSTFDVSLIGSGAQYRGFGVFEKSGSGTWTLTGTTTAVTPWTVNAGTLAITADSNLGAAAGTLTLNGGALQASGNFALDPSRAVTLGSAGGTFNIGDGSQLSISSGISGPGGLTKVGAGALTLEGSNSYAGGTVVNDGTLALASGASLNPSGSLTVNGGTFDLGGNNQTVGTLSGAGGTIDLGTGTLTTNSDANSTLASVITGAGAFVKQGSGTLILTGANNYTGGTTVSGGTLQGTTSSLQGAILNNASVVFSQGFAGTYAGDMSGSGSVTLQGGGVFAFTGNNSYTGPTTVTGGSTLAITADHNLGAAASTLALDGGILQASGSFALDPSRAVTLGSGGGSFSIGDGSQLSISSGISGPGGLTKVGDGTLVLTGANNYAGGTTVSGGTLQGTTSSLQGAILNNASVVFSQGFAGTYAGDMSGSGSVTLQGGGVFSFTGNNSYTGPTTVTGGSTLAITADHNLGAAASTLALDGGILQASGSFALDPSRAVALGSGGGSFSIGDGSQLSISSGISGPGGLTKAGGGILILTGANNYAGGTTVSGGTLQGTTSSLQGAILNNASVVFSQGFNGTYAGTMSGSGSVTLQGGGVFAFTGNNTYTGPTTVTGGSTLAITADHNLGAAASTLALDGGILQASGSFALDPSRAVTLGSGGGSFSIGDGSQLSISSGISGPGGLTKVGDGTLVLTGANNYAGGTTVSGGTLQGTTSSLQGDIHNNASVVFSQAFNGTYAGNMSGSGSVTLHDGAVFAFTGINTYTGPTTVTGGSTLAITADHNLGAAASTLALDGGTLQASGSFTLDPSRAVALGSGGGSFSIDDGSHLSISSGISGPGGLTKAGGGTLLLTGANNYAGGTTVSGGTLQGTTSSLQGAILNNASVVFSQGFNGTYAGTMSGSGSVTLHGGAVFTFTGNNTYTGPTTVTGSSTLYANGTMASDVVLTTNSTLRGNGTVGGFVSNNGVLAPGILSGNSIGTLTVTRNFAQSGGIYRVEVNSSGQNDRVNVGGTAAITGGTVQAFGNSGTYANSTTYTILHAAGGVSGAYGGVISDFAFLTPTLTYDANNVFLTLALQGNPFSGFGGNTPNQRAVGYALDQSYANATGDFATVISTLAGLDTQEGPLALSAISGEQWADFGTMNLASNSLFMKALGQQMAMARSGQAGGQRVALAQACDVAACDATSPFSAWASGLGGLGSVAGDGNASTLTYNFGGAAAGIDYRIDPRFLVGLGVAYTHGTQWVNSFSGTGWTDAVSVAAYASYTQGAFYADALAGYAYSNNQLQRQIAIPGLTQRTANGSTGANQFLGQVEFGYKVPVYAAAAATLTPFARLQVMNVSQNAFSETGANSLSLNVQQQTTNALSSTFGAELAGAIPISEGRNLDLALRLGWQHEYAYTGRPITAAFAGAPSASYTVYGATPQRDAALIGFSAGLPVAANTSVYARYDGDVGGGTDNHAFGVGLRMSW